MPFPARHVSGSLHAYAPRLVAFAHQSQAPPNRPPKNVLLFLAGLGDTLLSIRYAETLATFVPPNWSVVEVQLTSSGTGWTGGSLVRDAKEVEKAVDYFRQLKLRQGLENPRIVLMGHSTGSQVCMEYTVGPWKSVDMPARPIVDGIILQGGASDREGAVHDLGQDRVKKAIDLAKSWTADGRGEDVLPREATNLNGAPLFGESPCARRWLSLVQEEGDDDYFSSDLTDAVLERTFGELHKRRMPVLVLLSGNDEHMPAYIDKQQLLKRWQAFSKSSFAKDSGIIEGATHNLNRSSQEVEADLCQRVSGFLQSIEDSSEKVTIVHDEKL